MKINATTTFKGGNVSTQPRPIKSGVAKVVKTETVTNETSANLSRSVITQTRNDTAISSGVETSLAAVVQSAVSQNATVPVFSSTTNNVITPSFVKTAETTPAELLTTLVAKDDDTQLLGTSKTRPEIIALTSFNPIYDHHFKHASHRQHDDDDTFSDPHLNNVGRFLEDQIQMRSLLFENVCSYVREIREDDDHDEKIDKRKQRFQHRFQKAENDVQALYHVLHVLEKLKHHFDLNDLTPSITPVLNHFDKINDNLTSVATDLFVDNVISLETVLHEFGFASKNFKKFTSTKIYLQLLFNTQKLLESYSKSLRGESFAEEQQDDHPLVITKNIQRHVTFLDVASITLGSISDDDVSATLTNISAGYNSLTSLLPSDDKDRAAMLIALLSKEFRMSDGMAGNEVQKILSNYYGFESATGATAGGTLFDNVFGFVGNKITDPNPSDITSLSRLAQLTSEEGTGTLTVLPFENEYKEEGSALYTPGSKWLIDSAISGGTLHTERLTDYSSRLHNHLVKLRTLISKFHLFGFSGDGSNRFDALIDGSSLFKYIYGRVKHVSLTNSDSTVAIFKLARFHPNLKHLLFAYFMLLAEGDLVSNSSVAALDHYDGEAPPTDNVLDTLMKQIVEIVGVEYRSNTILNSNEKNVTQDTIQNELESGDLSGNVVSMLSGFLEEFAKNNAFTSSRKTLYSSVHRRTIALIAFEIILVLTSNGTTYEFTGAYTSTSSTPKYILSDIASAAEAPDDYSTNVKAKLTYEQLLLTECLFAILGILTTLHNVMQSAIKALDKGAKKVEHISKLLEDPDGALVKHLLTPAQIILSKALINDVKYSVFNKNDVSTDEAKVASNGIPLLMDDSVVTDNMRNALFSLLSEKKYTGDEADNMRLLTVGLPNGFIRQVKSRAEVISGDKNGSDDRELDIIKVCVYKIDLRYQDLIFKPQKFLFELSRFVPRHGKVDDIELGASMDDILVAVKTRDFSFHFNGDNTLATEEDVNIHDLLPDDHYSFLTKKQKRDLLENHVTSYLLEIYIRLMTGLSMTENVFFVKTTTVDDAISKTIEEDFSTSVMQSSLSSIIGEKFDLKNNDLKNLHLKISDSQKEKVVNSSKMLSTLSSMNTTISDVGSYVRKILTPKKFERVFTIPIDPDEFYIDVEATLAAETGHESFSKLLTQGIIEESLSQASTFESPQLFNTTTNKKHKLRKRKKKESHIALEKYFVTIETV